MARRLSGRISVLITGGPDEAGLTAAVSAAYCRAYARSRRTHQLFGIGGFAQLHDLVLGPDSGPLNLAVAVGTPTIHLFGPADPVRFGPWGDAKNHLVLQSDWTCVPCGRFDWPDLPEHGCVRDIAVDAVLDAAHHLLQA